MASRAVRYAIATARRSGFSASVKVGGRRRARSLYLSGGERLGIYRAWRFTPGFHLSKNLAHISINSRDGYIEVVRDLPGRKTHKEKLKDLLLTG
jgi:hypothetical protein